MLGISGQPLLALKRVGAKIWNDEMYNDRYFEISKFILFEFILSFSRNYLNPQNIQ